MGQWVRFYIFGSFVEGDGTLRSWDPVIEFLSGARRERRLVLNGFDFQIFVIAQEIEADLLFGAARRRNARRIPSNQFPVMRRGFCRRISGKACAGSFCAGLSVLDGRIHCGERIGYPTALNAIPGSMTQRLCGFDINDEAFACGGQGVLESIEPRCVVEVQKSIPMWRVYAESFGERGLGQTGLALLLAPTAG